MQSNCETFWKIYEHYMQINTFYTAYSVYFRWFHICDMFASGSGTIYE